MGNAVDWSAWSLALPPRQFVMMPRINSRLVNINLNHSGSPLPIQLEQQSLIKRHTMRKAATTNHCQCGLSFLRGKRGSTRNHQGFWLANTCKRWCSAMYCTWQICKRTHACSLIDNKDGTYTFTPDKDFNGEIDHLWCGWWPWWSRQHCCLILPQLQISAFITDAQTNAGLRGVTEDRG